MSSQDNPQTDEDSRKLFIGGLPSHVQKDEVQQYFSQYGEVEMCTIKTDVYTGRSRGFAFLIFKSVDSVNQVLNNPTGHEIGGKKVEAKLATPQTPRGEQEKSTKVFVGGLEKSMTKEDITNAFADRGNVVDVYLPVDKMSNEPKGFAFVNFDNANVAESLIKEGKITIVGKECDIKSATQKNDSRSMRGGMRGRGHRGGGGYGRADYGSYNAYQGGGYGQYNNGYGGGYDQYSGYNSYGNNYNQNYAGYDQYSGSGGGYDQMYGNTAGYDGGYGGGSGYGGQDQYKMKGQRGRGYTPY